MSKELKERIKAAPDSIAAEITQRHIDLYKGCKFDFEDNPVGEALREKVWEVISIGVYECYIGGARGGVPYVPSSETGARIHRYLTEGTMEPFVAEFDKKPAEAPWSPSARQEIYRDEEIAGYY